MSSTMPEPSVNDLNPVVPTGVDFEPILGLDTTGSMSEPASDGGSISRWSVITEALMPVVEKLAAKDAQAAKESADAGDEEGGLMTYTFADGAATELGDLNPGNLRDKIKSVRLGGGTYVMPVWEAMMNGYMEEFGSTPTQDRPSILALIITDGEANDTDDFAQTLSQQKGTTYVCVAILGYGAEHDRALAAYQRVAESNDHVRVVTFAEVTDPNTIADGLISLVGSA